MAKESVTITNDGQTIELPPKDEEELELEKLVFGDIQGFESGLKDIYSLDSSSEEEYNSEDENEQEDKAGVETLQDDQLFYVDGADGDVEMAEGGDDADAESSDTESEIEEPDAWEDSDDEKMQINLLESSKLKKLRSTRTEDFVNSRMFISKLRQQFEKLNPVPKWAQELDSDLSSSSASDSSDNDEEDVVTDSEDELEKNGFNINEFNRLVERNVNYTTQHKQQKLLSPKNVNIARLKDANFKHVSRSAIQALQFHPNLPILLTGGYDQSLRLYNIDGKNNNVITTIFFRKTPIENAFFTPSSNKIFLAGRRRYMHKLDLISGNIEKITSLYGIKQLQKSFENFQVSPLGGYIGLVGNNGYVNVLSVNNGTFVKNFKTNGVVADFKWTSDESLLIIVTKSSEVYEFDFKTGKAMNKWQDENGMGATKLSIGGKQDKWLAVGSSNGIVNIYDRLSSGATLGKPFGVVDNLITTISSLEFNFDGQLLCIASRAKKDSLRLVHLPSCSVFQNWPTSGTPLGKVTSVAFSPNSEMLAVGNLAGKVRLFKLNDY